MEPLNTHLLKQTFVFPKNIANKNASSCILRGKKKTKITKKKALKKPQQNPLDFFFSFLVENHIKIWVWSVSKFFFQWKAEKNLIFLLWVYRCFLIYHSKLRHKLQFEWLFRYPSSQFFLLLLVPSWFPKGLMIFSYLCALWLTQVFPQRTKELEPKGLIMVTLVTGSRGHCWGWKDHSF